MGGWGKDHSPGGRLRAPLEHGATAQRQISSPRVAVLGPEQHSEPAEHAFHVVTGDVQRFPGRQAGPRGPHSSDLLNGVVLGRFPEVLPQRFLPCPIFKGLCVLLGSHKPRAFVSNGNCTSAETRRVCKEGRPAAQGWSVNL